MNFLTQHIVTIIREYDGSLPLAIYLKSYFRQHPKVGSRDRKAIAEGVYIYYRSALFLNPDAEVLDTVRKGYYLCRSRNTFLAYKLGIDPEKVEIPDAYAPDIGVPLSASVDEAQWLKSHWLQPDVFIRIVQNEGLVYELLKQNDIPYQVEGFTEAYGAAYTCIRVPNSAPVDSILFPEDYVVQDRSSQLALLIAARFWKERQPRYFWDVCSGAGGKTLLLKHLDNQAQVMATDIRKSILFNLKGRCANYGFKDIVTREVDVTDAAAIRKHIGSRQYDVVLCDVPCSGSGTWSRTPEQLYFFNAGYFDQFAHLQYPIAANTIPYVRKGGLLVYITCSVMYHENEAVVTRLQAHADLQLLHQQMVAGVPYRADTLFVAIFEKL